MYLPITLSIIIPTLNEAANIEAILLRFQPMRGRQLEIIVIDGGSSDNTVQLAQPLADHVAHSARGRAAQMNTGAQQASGNVLLFLHADTVLPENFSALILHRLSDAQQTLNRSQWGRFNVTITGSHYLLPVIAWFMNHRSRLTGIATGDQAIFMTRAAFNLVGGFPDQALMEDVEMTKRLKRISTPLCLRERVITSGRRWEKYGVWRTVFLMWRLRLQYFFGVKPDKLLRAYTEK